MEIREQALSGQEESIAEWKKINLQKFLLYQNRNRILNQQKQLKNTFLTNCKRYSSLMSSWENIEGIPTYMEKTCDVAGMAILAKKIGGKSA